MHANKSHAFVGNSLCLSFDKESRPRFVIGPDWGYFSGMMSIIVVIAGFITFVAAKDKPFLQLGCFFVYGTTISCYLACALINPGVETKTY